MIRLPVPPADEQAAIVKYLAHANVRIDKAIAAKRRLIALLLEHQCSLGAELLAGVLPRPDADGDKIPGLARSQHTGVAPDCAKSRASFLALLRIVGSENLALRRGSGVSAGRLAICGSEYRRNIYRIGLSSVLAPIGGSRSGHCRASWAGSNLRGERTPRDRHIHKSESCGSGAGERNLLGVPVARAEGGLPGASLARPGREPSGAQCRLSWVLSNPHSATRRARSNRLPIRGSSRSDPTSSRSRRFGNQAPRRVP